MRSNLARGYGLDIGPILGWRTRSAEDVPGKSRALIAWSQSDGARRIAIGSHEGLFLQTAAGAVHDITPTGFTPGIPDAVVNTGFGAGPFGAWAFGTPRPDTGDPQPATVWALDTWGQYLVGCCPSDGRIVEWQTNVGTPAAVVANAPTDCRGVFTTQDRFTVAGAASGNPRLIAWGDRGDNTSWTPSTTNLAGDFELDTYGGYVTAVELRSQTLILTDIDAHSMSYVGLPSVYLINRIGDGCGAISAGCVATQGDFAMWWSKSGFIRFDGALSPIDCPIQDIEVAYNTAQQSKISAYHNARYSEFVWLYPSTASNENDSYISFNYLTGEWWQGQMVRLAGTAPGVFAFPLLTGNDGLLYEHEVGADYGGQTPSVRSGPIKLGDGVPVMRVSGGEFDVVGAIGVRFYSRDYPTSPEGVSAMATLAPGKTDLRFSGRQTEVEALFNSVDARFGQWVLLMEAGGRR